MMLNKIKIFISNFTGSARKYQQAVAFAESNNPEMAEEIFGAPEPVQEEKGPSRLLVVGSESGFSENIVEYALDMAKRMSYEIVALNSAPLSCETFRLFSSSRQQICDDFKALSLENAQAFRGKAQARGIPFNHVIKFDEIENAVEEVLRSQGNVDFVVSDTADPSENRVRDDNRPRNEVYVYSMSIT